MSSEAFPLGDFYITLHHTDRLTKAIIERGPARTVIGRAQDRDPARALGLAILDTRATLEREARSGGGHGPG